MRSAACAWWWVELSVFTMHKMSNLQCIDLKKENVAYVLYACMKSRGLAIIPQEISVFPWRSSWGKREDDENRFVRLNSRKLKDGEDERPWKQTIAILFTHFTFMLEVEGKRRSCSCSVVGRGQSKAVISWWTLPTASCQPSKSQIVFLSPLPTRLAAQRLLPTSASAGLAEEPCAVAAMLYFKNAAGRLDFTFWFVIQHAWGKMVRFPTRCYHVRLSFDIF